LEDGTLLITGDRKFGQNGKKDPRVEHAYGRFAHSFVLPADARPARISSVFKFGVLTVHLGKNGCSLAVARVRASLFPETQTTKKNENENETAIIPR
jgi:HSP20 family molecular chaperone IbpA